MKNLNIKNSISETTNTSDIKKKIAVLGVGNVGGKVIQHIINKNFNEVDLILLDSELQELNLSEAPKKIQLGKKLLKGLGAGVNPELGRDSVIESYDEIKNALKDMDIVFVVAGLGGGTGTGASSEIVKIAKENHCLVVSFVSTPFSWEKKRLNIAKEGVKKLEEVSDHVIVFSNDTIFEDAQLNDIGMKEVFKIMDNTLYQAIRNVYSNYIKNHKKGEKMLPLIIGGVALAVTGYGLTYGLKEYIQNNDKEYLVEEIGDNFINGMEDFGRKIADFGDSLIYGDEDETKPQNSIEKLDVINSTFFELLLPQFLVSYSKFKNLPNLEMKQFYILKPKLEHDLSTLTDKSKIELDAYIKKIAKGMYAVKVELDEIELLCNGNNNFNSFTKATKKKIKKTYSMMNKLIKVYKYHLENGKLSKKYKKVLDEIETSANKIV